MRRKLLVALCCLFLVPLLSAQRRVIIVRPYYAPYYHSFWGPWYYPGYYPGYFPDATYGKGEVKLENFDKHDDVYVNGAYAGSIAKAKSLWLAPGSYNVEVKSHGEDLVNRQVYVVAGKTLKIKAYRG